jgi:4-aminobutyrate aminotransferase
LDIDIYSTRRRKALQGCYPNLFPTAFVEGRGTKLKGLDGKEYTDFFAGIAVNNTGYCHPKVVKAIQEQAGRLGHALWHNLPVVDLADEVLSVTPKNLGKVYFCNSGNEAVEAVVKLSKKFAISKGRPGSHVVVLDHAFHGRGGTTLSLTGESTYKRWMGGFANYPGVIQAPSPYCYRCKLDPSSCDLDCANKIDDLLNYHHGPENIACVMIEPVLGEGGVIVPPDGYLKKVAKICSDAGVLFAADEVQTGFGRTGKMFACEHEGILPDIMSLGKALGGGLPLAGTVTTDSVDSAWAAGDHATTFSANPICCAAGLASIMAIKEEGLISNAQRIGLRLINGLKDIAEKAPRVGDVRGRGLMIGIELVEDKATKRAAREAANKIKDDLFKKGLIVGTGGIRKNVVRILPPLVINDEDADILLEAMGVALTSA